MIDETPAKIARLEVKAENTEKKIDSMEQDVKDIKATVNQMNLILAERKGGTKYLMVLLTVAASFGAIVTHTLNWFKVI